MRVAIGQILLAAVALIAVAATAVPNTSKYAYGIIKRSCAPWDGSALALTVTAKPAHCQTGAPYLLISLYDLPITTGKAYPIGIQGEVKIGQASRCPDSNSCQSADSGEVVFDSFAEDKGASGHYRFHFPGSKNGSSGKRDPSHMEGAFQLKWCNHHELCG